MTCSSLAFSVSPSCTRKGCFCCTASTCVLAFLLTILSRSPLSPESAPDGLSPLPKYTPAGHQTPAVLKGQLLMVLSGEPALFFCPDSSSPHSCRTGDMSWLTGKGS